MADNCHMEAAEMDAQQQMMEAFQQLAPLFQVKDETLQLPPNPRATKARRREDQGNQGSTPAVETQGGPGAPAMQMLALMTQLLVKHDQELQSLRRMDQFILFLNPEPTGALHVLLQESAQWKKKMDDASASLKMPLRQHLMITLINVLQSRAGKIVESKETDVLYTTSLQKGVILADRSFPFHRWDSATQKLILDKKQPISAQKMKQHLDELLDMLTDKELIVRFHALRPVQDQTNKVVPWRLQINMRSDRPYELLFQLAHSAIWMTVGASMKPHTQGQTPLATTLQSMLNKSKGKGKGKGRQPSK